MIYKLETLPDGTITGYRMVSERDRECGPDEVVGNPGQIVNADGKCIKRLIDNPDFGKVIGQRPVGGVSMDKGAATLQYEDIRDTRRRIIVSRHPDPPTAAEVEAARIAAIKAEIHAAYTQDDELKLMALGIADPTDAEYLAYRKAIAEIKAKHPKETA
ncbi:mediator of RNA polymerase II transcription subunit 18 [Candidatus Pacearchaeota archaeon]|jgi:hypothetical protein|nr:mediator of RNA polymerase II transcription subunit 18 [Candidatus Pacearchaeota archaeon]